MKQIRYPHAATQQLESLEPLNAPRLHDQIYDLLVAGLDFTPERAVEYQDKIALLGTLQMIAADYTAEAGPFGDVFGEYLECTGQADFRTGQFLTPVDLADLTAKFTCGDLDLGGRPKLISDPAAGTGRFMLRTAKHFAEENGGALNFLFVTVDSDRRMFTYCTMNAILHRIPAICIHGDALTVEAWEAFGVVDDGMTVRWERVRLDVAKDLIVAGKQGQQPVVAATRFPGVRTEG
jgi:hypothetical protein